MWPSARALRMARPSAARADPEALLGQRARDQIANLAMVVDDQDMRRSRHGRTIDQGPIRSVGMCFQVVANVAPDTLCHKKPRC